MVIKITTLTLPESALIELRSVLQPHARVRSPSTFPMTVELVPTKITDQDGNVREIIE